MQMINRSLKLPEVCLMVSKSKSAIYREMNPDYCVRNNKILFPRPRKNGRESYWWTSDIQDYVYQLPEPNTNSIGAKL